MSVSAADVKKLREMTGAGIKKVKDALESAGGDFDKAAKILREQGEAKAAKRVDREAHEGVIQMYSHGGRIGVMVEVNCETDFVARNEQFQQLAHDLALQVASMSPRYLTKDEVPEADLDEERAFLIKQAMDSGKPEEIAKKMVEGRMRKFYEEYCLLEMPFIKDEKRKMQDLVDDARIGLGENIVVRRFVRYELGEEI